MLLEETLFGTIDKVKVAIERLKEHEPPEGYYVCFSGGKDSTVMYDLVKKSGVKYDVHYSIMTVEPPDLLEFVKTNYPEVELIAPPFSMFDLIEKHGMPPMRKFRFCTFELKMSKGAGRTKVDGVRAQESRKRKGYKIFDEDRKNGGYFLHVIHDWTEKEIWQYIRENKLPYCKLYDKGFKRLGCLLCPCAVPRTIALDLKTFPEIAEKYRQACCKAYEKRIARGKSYKKWISGDDMFNDWIAILLKTDFKAVKTKQNEISLFEERERNETVDGGVQH